LASFIPAAGTKFRWRSAIIDVCNAVERYQSVGTEGGTTANAIQQTLEDIDQRLFADGFGPTRTACLTEVQWREWIQRVLKACEHGITEFRPEPPAEQKKRTEFVSAWAALRALDVRAVLVVFREGAGIPEDVPFADRAATFQSAEVGLPWAAQVKLEDLVRRLSDDLLLSEEVPDWYNNDGGYGTLEWRLHPAGNNELRLIVNQYVERPIHTTELIYDELGANCERSDIDNVEED
jgi:hypothetical protein